MGWSTQMPTSPTAVLTVLRAAAVWSLLIRHICFIQSPPMVTAEGKGLHDAKLATHGQRSERDIRLLPKLCHCVEKGSQHLIKQVWTPVLKWKFGEISTQLTNNMMPRRIDISNVFKKRNCCCLSIWGDLWGSFQTNGDYSQVENIYGSFQSPPGVDVPATPPTRSDQIVKDPVTPS